MKMQRITGAISAPLNRIDGVQKVTGAANYAYEYPVEGVTYVFPVQSTIARGRVVSIDASAAQALPGVIAVLSHENAPQLAPLDDAELAVFQSDAIAYHRQFVAAVVAETSEIARQAASLVVVRYQEQSHDVELRTDRGDFFTPEKLGGGFGSKSHPHPHTILTVMAAQVARRPVKFALTRQQMFALVGYRTPTIQRMRLGANHNGQLTTSSRRSRILTDLPSPPLSRRA